MNPAALKCDSRRVQPGDTFVAVRGAADDGSRFIAAAIEAGAAEIVTELPRPAEGVPDGVAWRTVEDSRREIAALACRAYGDPSAAIDVFGVTGTNGKTTTATLLRKILNDCGIPSGLVSTISYITAPPLPPPALLGLLGRAPVEAKEIPAHNTTPGPLELQSLFAEMRDNGCKAAVMEVSSHAIAQRRVEGTRFAAVAFTNLTQDHLDYHGTMEAYFEAKRQLFVPARFPAAINLDCPYGRRLFDAIKSDGGAPALSYGAASDADVRFSNERLSSLGCEFRLDYPGGSAQVRLRLLGRHNIHNALCAFATALLHGIPARMALDSLATAKPVRGRLEMVRIKASPATYFIDYAHTPDAIENVLNTLREITEGRLFIVFGAGGDRDRRKRPLMGEAAARLADVCIVTSDNPRSEDPAAIIEDILAGMPEPEQPSEPPAAEPVHSASAPGVLRPSPPWLGQPGAERTAALGQPDAMRPACSRPAVLIEPDRRAAIRRTVLLADQPGDVVLIAGKGHETDQIFADRTDHFDDREELISWGS